MAAIDAGPTPLQRARAIASAAHRRCFHARGPPAKRPREEDDTAPVPSHLAELDAQAIVWEEVALTEDGNGAPPLTLQRYLAHTQNLCAHMLQHTATRGWAPPSPQDPDLVPTAGMDCLNMGNNPKGLRVSVQISFYPQFFKIDHQPFVHDYSRSNKRLLLAIQRGRLPLRLMNEKQCYFYNGCVLVELRDFRGRQPIKAGAPAPAPGRTASAGAGAGAAANSPPQSRVVVSRVLLQPCADAVIDDLVRTRGRASASTASGSQQMRLLSMQNLVEAERYLVNGSASICLDPSPTVAAAAAALNFSAHKFDEMLETLSPLLPSSHAEATYREQKARRTNGTFEEREAVQRPATVRRPTREALKSANGSAWHNYLPEEDLAGLTVATGSGLPHGAVVLLNQKLYTTRQWGRAESSYMPYRSVPIPTRPNRPVVIPAKCPTPEEVLSKAEAKLIADGRDPSPPQMRGGARHLREQRYCNREENYFYILDLMQNEGDAGFECVIRCGHSPQACTDREAETHSVHMPSVELLYKFARQFARLKLTEGCICFYDSMQPEKRVPLQSYMQHQHQQHQQQQEERRRLLR